MSKHRWLAVSQLGLWVACVRYADRLLCPENPAFNLHCLRGSLTLSPPPSAEARPPPRSQGSCDCALLSERLPQAGSQHLPLPQAAALPMSARAAAGPGGHPWPAWFQDTVQHAQLLTNRTLRNYLLAHGDAERWPELVKVGGWVGACLVGLI